MQFDINIPTPVVQRRNANYTLDPASDVTGKTNEQLYALAALANERAANEALANEAPAHKASTFRPMPLWVFDGKRIWMEGEVDV